MNVRLVALRRRPQGILFGWDPGGDRLVTPRELRLACPCAHCVHEVSGRRLLDPADVAEGIAVRDMQPTGHYGYRILFDDGHDSGIYPLELLAGLGSAAAAGAES